MGHVTDAWEINPTSGTKDTWVFPFRASVATFQLIAGLGESLLNRFRRCPAARPDREYPRVHSSIGWARSEETSLAAWLAALSQTVKTKSSPSGWAVSNRCRRRSQGSVPLAPNMSAYLATRKRGNRAWLASPAPRPEPRPAAMLAAEC